jgi:hypothetical protein
MAFVFDSLLIAVVVPQGDQAEERANGREPKAFLCRSANAVAPFACRLSAAYLIADDHAGKAQGTVLLGMS